MSIAVTKGKISRTGSDLVSNSEDLLTASVFGLIRYLPAEILLIPILGRAKNIDGETLQIGNNIKDDSIHFDFWPPLEYSEPDIKIDLGNNHAIFIEAKFYSGKSGGGEKDQLYRQYQDLCKVNSDSGSIIYLTKGRIIPEAEILESVKAVGDFGDDLDPIDFQNNTYWLSWFDIWEICKSKTPESIFQKRIITDICELLERLGLKHFTGFSDIHEVEYEKETN